MNPSVFISIFTFILFSGCNHFMRNEPALLTMDYEHLLEIKESISKKSPLYEAAYQRLCKEADNALNLPAYTVTHKTGVPPSGDKRDYMSQAPYWWPDPSKPGGLPYIRRDGIRNPEAEENMFDRHRLNQMTDDVLSLTLTWFFTGEAKYAEKASDLIQTWFIDPETGVNPNLRYAQAIPGIVDGRGIGIIDTRRYIEIIDAVKLLETSSVWSKRMSKKLQDWFSDYLYWMMNSEQGLDEKSKENNHGTWYDLQVATYALFTGDNEHAMEVVRQSGLKRIGHQIDSSGRQGFELDRTNAFSYSVFNLEALLLLGKTAEMMGEEFWWDDPTYADKIKSACDFLFSYIETMGEWPYEQITPVESTRLIPVVLEASRIFEDPAYNLYIEYLEEKIKSNDRLIITKI